MGPGIVPGVDHPDESLHHAVDGFPVRIVQCGLRGNLDFTVGVIQKFLLPLDVDGGKVQDAVQKHFHEHIGVVMIKMQFLMICRKYRFVGNPTELPFFTQKAPFAGHTTVDEKNGSMKTTHIRNILIISLLKGTTLLLG